MPPAPIPLRATHVPASRDLLAMVTLVVSRRPQHLHDHVLTGCETNGLTAFGAIYILVYNMQSGLRCQCSRNGRHHASGG